MRLTAGPPFNGSGSALRACAPPQSGATMQAVCEAEENMVALPGQFFYSTQIPACFWFLVKIEPAPRTEACFAFNFGPN